MNMEKELRTRLELDEGLLRFPYVDTVGKVTIGIGRNLTDVGVSGQEIDFMYEHDVAAAKQVCANLFPEFYKLDAVRQIVLIDMAFNLGGMSFAGFRNTIALVNSGKFKEAATNMLKSKWARQVGDRALRLANMMRTGALR